MSIIETLMNRRSVRKYTDEKVSDEVIDKILQAGLLAPSSRAIFPVDFIVVRDKSTLLQLSRAKMAGSGFLEDADVAIVVIGNTEKSDAWIEDCSIAMILMQLEATELGIGNCWVQCRNRTSQQKKSADEFLRAVLHYPEHYSVEAILSLGMPNQKTKEHELPDTATAKVHKEVF